VITSTREEGLSDDGVIVVFIGVALCLVGYAGVSGQNRVRFTCLKRVAACVRAELRNDGDLGVRYGGEEFLLLLPRTEMADAVRVAERIRRATEALGIPHHGAVRHSSVTVSLGVTAAPASTLSAEELISAADTALYAAKRNGRNQVCPPLLRHRGSSNEGSGTSIVSINR
jgi:predicted signal transduction protein with EAL and GGDEF domain